MYWQVYLHKTVVCVEQMLIKAVERAKELIAKGEKLDYSPALGYFFTHPVTIQDFADNKEVLDMYSCLDDMDIMSALKYWRHSNDTILSFLCTSILDRRLFKIEMSNQPFATEKINVLLQKASKAYNISEEDARYLVFTDSTSNHAYNPAEDHINILLSDGSVTDIARASDQFNISNLSEPVVKYYLCYPKGMKQ
jgi:HD superfamily phosphohydrolase